MGGAGINIGDHAAIFDAIQAANARVFPLEEVAAAAPAIRAAVLLDNFFIRTTYKPASINARFNRPFKVVITAEKKSELIVLASAYISESEIT